MFPDKSRTARREIFDCSIRRPALQETELSRNVIVVVELDLSENIMEFFFVVKFGIQECAGETNEVFVKEAELNLKKKEECLIRPISGRNRSCDRSIKILKDRGQPGFDGARIHR